MTAKDASACCVPALPTAAASAPCRAASPPVGGAAGPGLRLIEPCTFLMGSHDPLAHPLDGEGPVRAIDLDAFEIAATAVSNAEYAVFVARTGYRTDAETIGWSAVFDGFLDAREEAAPRHPSIHWWRRLPGASWHAPEGPGSGIADRPDHPVVHISFNDALAYCAWANVRLPTEAEWECAARGGLVQKRYPWGDDLAPGGLHRCNIWQGAFPEENTAEDGFVGTAPVTSYAPNGFGLFNMVGNTWEWCADWFDRGYHARATFQNPLGPPTGTNRVIRGGSYLCHISYCARYRVSARSSAPPNTATGHLGFRVARTLVR